MNYFVLRFDHSYRREDILALSRLSGRVLRKWRSRILSLLGYGVGIFAVLTGILLLWSEERVTPLGATMLLLGVLCIVSNIFRYRLNVWGAAKQAIRVENLTMKFTDEGLTEQSSKATLQMPYSAFERILHYRGRYFLFVDRMHAYILPEDRFAVGDPADFPRFIAEKIGKPIESIK